MVSLSSRLNRWFAVFCGDTFRPEGVPNGQVDQGLHAPENAGTTSGVVADRHGHNHHREDSGDCHQEKANSP